MRLTTPAALVAATVALAVPVVAHGDEGSLEGFASTITAVEPTIPNLTFQILEGDDEIELTNGTGKTVLIYGYQKEPYLRFAPDGVYENQRSPAAFLNDDRFGKTAVPKDASVKAEPRWQLQTKESTFSWHDHRIHWMSPILPPVVSENEDEHSHVFDWRIDAEADGTKFAVLGSLDYEPPDHDDSGSPLPFIGGGVVLVVLAAGLAFFGIRKFRRKPA